MLCGRRIESLADARDAARRIRDLGPRAVIVTGGHASFGADVVDVLIDDDDIHELTVARVDSAGAHGTGCTFAAAVAAGLAAGEPLVDAAAAAQTYVAGALRHAISPGRGRAVLHHFWRMHR
jgi:hydroxymethylpyrimidine/phosphomethylpyrimidine kinase